MPLSRVSLQEAAEDAADVGGADGFGAFSMTGADAGAPSSPR